MRILKAYGLVFAGLGLFLGINGLSISQEGKDPVAETRASLEKSYRELFESLDEDYQIDAQVYQRVYEMLREQDTKEVGDAKLELKKIEEAIKGLRKERKQLHEALTRLPVQIQRLEKEREKQAQAGKDTAGIDAELEKLRIEAKDKYAQSEGLKRQIDGDTTYNMADAEEKLEGLREALENTPNTDPARETIAVEIAKIEKAMELARGLRGEAAQAKKKIQLIQGHNSHRFAKLASLKRWPPKLRQINDTIIAGKQSERKHGNIEAIGNLEERRLQKIKVWKILPGMISMQNEIKIGREIAQEITNSGQVQLHTDPLILEYVKRVGENIVRNSDAWCPFDFYVIADPPGRHEINAFALPGGQVFVNDSLILAMKTQAEFAGVIGHEIAHVNARHAVKRLSKMQYIQAAAMASVLFGPVGYWGYQGIGAGMNLLALGITRESETEADILGTQYMWNAGYDPRSLIDGFDRLLKDHKLGGSSFWRTHPSLDDRMERVEEEVRYLPPKDQQLVNTQEFSKVQKAIWASRMAFHEALGKEENRKKPTLKRPGEEGPSSEPETPGRPVLKRPSKDPNEKPPVN